MAACNSLSLVFTKDAAKKRVDSIGFIVPCQDKVSPQIPSPNSAIEFLVLPADAPRHDHVSESRQEAVNLMASMSMTSLFSVLWVHFSFLRTSLSFPQ